MGPSKVELAVLNNVDWYTSMFEAHGLTCEVDGRVWRSRETAPQFHSNLVVLSSETSQADIDACVLDLATHLHGKGWSVKDSFACLDFSALGFTQLFRAEWIWRAPVPLEPLTKSARLVWTRVSSAAALREWENAWSGNPMNDSAGRRTRQFPAALLASPDHAFFAGRLQGRLVAGGIANRSHAAVGLSNVFSPGELADEAWRALVTGVSTAFPGVPIVGYERDADLALARGVGFVSIGPLRIWCRTE